MTTKYNHARGLAAGKKETEAVQTAELYIGGLEDLQHEPEVIDYGAIILCTAGTATIRVDFKEWRLGMDSVITLFPNDVVTVCDASPDFCTETLCYDKTMLREASLQIEQAVYSRLRKDRFRGGDPVVANIVKAMLGLLHAYLEQEGLACLNQIILYQLKSFFLGFYDHAVRSGTEIAHEARRTDELFNKFMETLETDYMKAHDAAYYAERLNITPKYLNKIVKQTTGHTTKEIVDHYVILQIKLCLRKGGTNIKQLAWMFHFSDTPFFCRYFKQHTGMTPKQFSKKACL